MFVPLVERRPPAGKKTEPHGVEFQQQWVDTLIRLPGGDVGVPAGLGAAAGRPPRPPPGCGSGFEGGDYLVGDLLADLGLGGHAVFLYTLTDLHDPRLLPYQDPHRVCLRADTAASGAKSRS